MDAIRKQVGLFGMFQAIRPGLEEKYREAANYGGNAADVVSEAFEFAARKLLTVDREATTGDLRGLINWKAEYLMKDLGKSAARSHGRRSVRAAAVLDADIGSDGESLLSPVDRYSSRHYLAHLNDWHDELRHEILVAACRRAFEGVSPRERAVFNRRVFEHAERRTVAEEFGTSLAYVDKTVCKLGRLVRALGEEMRDLYDAAA